jgi:hypothetical protein
LLDPSAKKELEESLGEHRHDLAAAFVGRDRALAHHAGKARVA